LDRAQGLDCVYTPAGGIPEYYKGKHQQNRHRSRFSIPRRDRMGSDLACLTLGPGALTGNYVGLAADVAAGLGAGANALIGGNKVVLQPLSVSGDIGINLAAGIGGISRSPMSAVRRQSCANMFRLGGETASQLATVG
jgi:Protein of unknown function (DUF992)